jgi:hypothetical protein
MDAKWIITTLIMLLTALFTGWAAYSSYKQANTIIQSERNTPIDIEKSIEINKEKWYYEDDMIDSIIVNRDKQDLLFSVVNETINGYNVGEYHKNANAERTLKLVEKEIDKYFLNRKANEDIYLLIWAKGYADGTKVNPNSFYDGNSIYDIEYYYEDDYNFQNPQNVNFIRGATRMKNEYYAVLRAYYIVEHLKIAYPKTDKSQIKIIAEEFKEIGPQNRGCDLQIAIKNAFKNQYDELGWGAMKFIEWGWVK